MKITRFLATLALSTFPLVGCSPLEFSEEPCYQCPIPKYDRIRVAFVLGGGGAKGMAHVAVLEELLKAGIKPDLIVGCSAGAIVGALYADQLDIAWVKNLLMTQKRENIINFSLSFLPFGLSDGNALQDFLLSNLKSHKFEDLKIPFIAVATNLQYGTLTAFGSGPLEPALRASSCIPGVFVPTKIQNQYFVDGGVIDNVPAEIARQLGAEYVIAVELQTDLDKDSPTNVLGIVKRSLEISLHNQTNHSRKYASYVIQVPLTGIGTLDDGVNEIVYAQGKKAADYAIPRILKHMPEELRPKT